MRDGVGDAAASSTRPNDYCCGAGACCGAGVAAGCCSVARAIRSRIDAEAAAVAVELQLFRRQVEADQDLEVLARDVAIGARNDDVVDVLACA